MSISYGIGRAVSFRMRQRSRGTSDKERRMRNKYDRISDIVFGRTFWWAEGENDSRILTWQDFALNRDTNRLVSAQMVLKANGDFTLSSNEVVRSFQRVETFDWDGETIGQTDEERECVAAEVGAGLENGYYRFRATFSKAPRRRTLVTVGTNRVVVADAGGYDFLLEKGIEYTFGTEPVNTNVIYTAVDDVPREGENGLMLASNDAWVTSGTWSVDGGWLRLIEPTFSQLGSILWMPRFSGSPDIAHVGPGEVSFTCAANFMDGKEPQGVSYFWSVRQGDVRIDSPRSRETNVRIGSMPNWNPAELAVTARFGTNSLTSTLKFSYGKNSEPQTSLFISVPSLLIRKDLWMAGSAPAKLLVEFHSDREMSGTLTLRQKSGEGLVALSREFSGRHTLSKDKFYYEVFDVSGIKESSQENDVCFECVFTPSDSSEAEIIAEAECTVLAPVRVEVPCAPTTGLAVLKGTGVATKLIFAPSNTTLAPVVEWRTAKRKTRTQYDDWVLREGSSSNETTLTMNEAGVFALCARMICGSQSNEVEYVHLTERPYCCKLIGSRDHIGVTGIQMLSVRNAALSKLGIVDYAKGIKLFERNGFSEVPSGKWKCNAFLADTLIVSGYVVPRKHFTFNLEGFHYYPPLANEWARGEVSMDGWRYCGIGAYPIPGQIIAHPASDSGHCGIVDYDGEGIAAGKKNVNREYSPFLDGTSGFYSYEE